MLGYLLHWSTGALNSRLIKQLAQIHRTESRVAATTLVTRAQYYFTGSVRGIARVLELSVT